eukprot:2039330-Pyramimonas_sp.AAC.1
MNTAVVFMSGHPCSPRRMPSALAVLLRIDAAELLLDDGAIGHAKGGVPETIELPSAVDP